MTHIRGTVWEQGKDLVPTIEKALQVASEQLVGEHRVLKVEANHVRWTDSTSGDPTRRWDHREQRWVPA